MATNVFPAMSIRPEQAQAPPDMLSSMIKIQQLRQQAQLMPLQLQQEQQQVALQAQQLRDVQAGQAAYGEWDPKDGYQGLASLIVKNGGSLSAANSVAAAGLGLQEKMANTIKANADAGRAQVETTQKNWDLAAGATNAVLNLPDDQIQQGLVDEAARGIKEGWLDPVAAQHAQQLAQQPVPQIRAALPNIVKSFQAESAAAESALKSAEAFEAQQRGLETQAMMQAGGTPQMMDVKYQNLKQQQALGQPIGANDQAFMKAYEQRKLLVPQTVANIRIAGMEQARMMPVIDTKNNNALTYANVADINAANQREPGRYVPAGEGAKSLSKEALLEDIRGNIQQVRVDLSNPKMPEFTAGQRAQIAIAMGGRNPGGAVAAMIQGGALGNLTTEQQQYLIDHAQLAENAMAMRSTLGAGQGSEDVRSAITATIPGPAMPSKAYGLKQLDAFEKTLNRVGRGVPNVPLAGTAPPAAGAAGGGATAGTPQSHVFSKSRWQAANPRGDVDAAVQAAQAQGYQVTD